MIWKEFTNGIIFDVKCTHTGNNINSELSVILKRVICNCTKSYFCKCTSRAWLLHSKYNNLLWNNFPKQPKNKACSTKTHLKVIWKTCPRITCWVLLLYPRSISLKSVSLKRESCFWHFGPSQWSARRRQERPSPASLYSCTHLITHTHTHSGSVVFTFGW